jgi:hypothetical protein
MTQPFAKGNFVQEKVVQYNGQQKYLVCDTYLFMSSVLWYIISRGCVGTLKSQQHPLFILSVPE